MVKSPIKVLVRTRPTTQYASKSLDIDEQAGQISLTIPKNESQGYVNHQQENWNFKFDKVLRDSSQEIVFDSTAKEILQSALEGYSGTVLCYGQTGAGKSYTMNGEPLKQKQKGIIPRTINALFKETQSRPNQSITLKVSYVEIYNETISDLLDPNPDATISINEDPKKGACLKGITYRVCSNEKEALRCLLQGNLNRTVSATALNPDSSRSHAIFTVYLEMRSKFEYNEKIIYSKLNLVDLAGSERTKKTKSEGRTLVEANYINKSLFFLEQMVVALTEKQREHVPYRHSKLTFLLKDSIGGNSKTLMIANILPEFAHLEETISTLKFATRMMKVSNEAQINVKLDPQALIKKYESEIQQLRRELVTQSVFGNKTPLPYERVTIEQKQTQYKTVKSYLKGEIEEIEIQTIPHAQGFFKQFRRAYRNLFKQMKKKILARHVENHENKNGMSSHRSRRDNGELKVIENFQPTVEANDTIKKRQKAKYNKASIDKNITEDDIKNLTTYMSTMGDDSTEVIHVEQDSLQDSEKKSYYVSSIQKINDLEKTELFSQSNIYEEREISDDCKIPKASGKRHKPMIPSKYSFGSRDDLPDLTQKALESKSLQYLQDMTPRSLATDVIRTENDLRHPRRKFRSETEKIQDLKFTINLINQSIHEAKSMLCKQFDEYKKKGYINPKKTNRDYDQPDQSENILSQSLQENPTALAFVSN